MHIVHIEYCTSDTLPRFLLLQKASSENPKDHSSLQADICDGLHSSAATCALSLDVRNKRSSPSCASIQEKNTNTKLPCLAGLHVLQHGWNNTTRSCRWFFLPAKLFPPVLFLLQEYCEISSFTASIAYHSPLLKSMFQSLKLLPTIFCYWVVLVFPDFRLGGVFSLYLLRFIPIPFLKSLKDVHYNIVWVNISACPPLRTQSNACLALPKRSAHAFLSPWITAGSHAQVTPSGADFSLWKQSSTWQCLTRSEAYWKSYLECH